jgi:hypothetical protein
MSEKTLLKRLDAINDLIMDHAEKNYQGNLNAGGEGRTTGKRDKKIEKAFKERETIRSALKRLKARGGGSVGGNTVGSLAAGSRNNAIKKLMKDM